MAGSARIPNSVTFNPTVVTLPSYAVGDAVVVEEEESSTGTPTTMGAMVGAGTVSVANMYGAQVVGSGAGTGASVGDAVFGSESVSLSLLLSLPLSSSSSLLLLLSSSSSLRLGLRVGLRLGFLVGFFVGWGVIKLVYARDI